MKRPRIKMLGPRVSTLDTRVGTRLEKETDRVYGTAAHKRRRREACEAAGWRCEWILPDGSRCPKSRANGDTMIGDHVEERSDGGADDGEYQCLCAQHNTLKGARARTARFSRRS